MQSASAMGPFGKSEASGEMPAEIGQRGAVDRPRHEGGRDVVSGSMLRHDEGRLGEQRLPIAAAFSRDDPIRTLECGVKADELRDDLGAGVDRPAEQLEGKAQAACRAGAGPVGDVAHERRLGQLGVAAERFVDARDVVRHDALLRSEDRGRSQRAGERVVDVGHDAKLAAGDTRIETDGRDACKRGEAVGRRRDRARPCRR